MPPRKKLTQKQRDELLAMLEEDGNTETEETEPEEHATEAQQTTNHVVVFTGTPDEFFAHFQAVPVSTDDSTSEQEPAENDVTSKEEPTPKPRSKFFPK